jgi:predicted Zn-dependent protease
MKGTLKILIILAVIIAVAAPAAMAQGQLRVQAKILDQETKEPVADARVVTYQPERPNNRWDDKANDNGVVTIVGLIPGRVTFEVTAEGYQNGRFTLRVPSGRPRVEFTIELTPIKREKGQATEEIVAEYNQGMELSQAGKHEEALKLFVALVEQYPDIKQLYLAAAGEYNALNRYEEALAVLNKLYEMDPGNTDVMLRIAEAHSALGNSEDATKWYASILEKDPEDLYAIEKIAFSAYEAGNYPDAATYYEKALAINPENPIAHYYLGNIYYVGDNFEKALEHYTKYVELDPDNKTGGLEAAKMTIDDIKKRMEAEQ